jgi:hypothetical protein
MADSGIKKAIIKKALLPAIDSDNIGYIFRYRVISEDKNRTSQWSPVNLVIDNSITTVNGALQISQTITTVVWGDELNRPKYDIFVGFDNATPTYHGTSPIHTYSFLNTGTTDVRVIVQVEASQKELYPSLQIYDSGIEFLV